MRIAVRSTWWLLGKPVAGLKRRTAVMKIKAKLKLATASYAKLSEAENWCIYKCGIAYQLTLDLKMWQLVLSLLQHLSATPAIVVERNMFAYYKLPLKLLDTDAKQTDKSISNLYYVLQCPPKLDDSIPKPKDMQSCTVVDQYKDIWRSTQNPRIIQGGGHLE